MSVSSAVVNICIMDQISRWELSHGVMVEYPPSKQKVPGLSHGGAG